MRKYLRFIRDCLISKIMLFVVRFWRYVFLDIIVINNVLIIFVLIVS